MRAAMLRLTIGAVALLAVSTAAFAQGKVPDPCAVVTKGELEQTFGVKLADGIKDNQVAGTGVVASCTYLSNGPASVSIGVRQDPATIRANEKAGIAMFKPRPVAGVGTDAFLVDIPGSGTQLTAYRGPRDAVQIAVMVEKADAKTTQAGLEKIAKLVFERWK